jgi:hypothetical protein
MYSVVFERVRNRRCVGMRFVHSDYLTKGSNYGKTTNEKIDKLCVRDGPFMETISHCGRDLRLRYSG